MIRILPTLFSTIAFMVIICLQSSTLMAQPDFSKIKFEDYIYVDYIKSIQFNDGLSQFSDPVTTINGKLYLSFDDLDSERYEYNYMIIHCDRDWNPSEIEQQEYVVGFNYDEIPDQGTISRFTQVDYVHYKLDLPTRQVSWTISGNYLLLIYDQNDNPVLSRRFVIYETLGKLETERLRSINSGEQQTYHRLGVTYSDLPPDFTERMYLEGISIKTMQNNNWSTLSDNLKPTFYQSNKFLFDQTKFPSFGSYRDYRQCDIRALEFKWSNIREIRREKDSTFVVLPLGKPFNRETFSHVFDKNGRFVINRLDGNLINRQGTIAIAEADYNEEDRITGDYAWVIFAIEGKDLPDAPVYIIGEFSDFKLYPEYQLHYDEKRDTYIGACLMKQGHYDFHIVQLIDNAISYEHTERLDDEATQDYRVFVYYREYGGLYDRVLNVDFLNVNKDL